MAVVEASCSRCKGKGHRAAVCPNLPFFKLAKTCQYCKVAGHTVQVCPVLRRCAYCKCDGHTELNCPKKPLRRVLEVPPAEKATTADDLKSETSQGTNGRHEYEAASAASTVASNYEGAWDWSWEWYRDQEGSWKWFWKKAWKPESKRLTANEEREARKVEKKLREIAALEKKLATGKKMDALEQKKVDRKAEFENLQIMQKVRDGYRRCKLQPSQVETK